MAVLGTRRATITSLLGRTAYAVTGSEKETITTESTEDTEGVHPQGGEKVEEKEKGLNRRYQRTIYLAQSCHI